ncbi:hypothetical protein NMY22_g15755 [Coprinellus aureogranulatus]|nr:hypothetical protein NMY22_g15755 [Coprinellus aureogranulatus]
MRWDNEERRRVNMLSSFKGRQIPRNVIVAAMQWGNHAALMDLFGGLNESNYRIEVLDVIFHHLDPLSLRPPDVPPSFRATARTYVEGQMHLRAHCALFCATQGILCTLHSGCPQRKLPPQYRQKIISHLDDSMAWLKYLLSGHIQQQPTDPAMLTNPMVVCRALCELMEVDELLKRHILGLQSVAEYSMAAWAVRDRQTGEAFQDWIGDPCQITRLFRELLSHNDSKEQILHLLSAPGGKGKIFRSGIVRGALSRCDLVTTLSRPALEREFEERNAAAGTPDTRSFLEVILKYLHSVFQVVEIICGNPEMASVLLKSAFSERLTQAIRIWLLEKSEREKDRRERELCFLVLVSLTFFLKSSTTAFEGRNRRLAGRAWASILRVGFMAILVEGMRSIPVTDEQHESIQYLLKILHNACETHLTLGVVVSSEVEPLLGKDYWNTTSFSATGWDTPWWRVISTNIAAASLTPFSKDNRSLCDNLVCPRTHPTAQSSKECSACHTVVYCSEDCQKADWKYHRAECGFKKTQSLSGLAGHVRYRQPIRQYHALLAAHRCYAELCQSALLREQMDKEPSILVFEDQKPKVLTVADYFVSRADADVLNGKYGDKWDPAAGYERYSEGRLADLVGEYLAHGHQNGMRLVEAKYSFGRRVAKVLSAFHVDANVPYDLSSAEVDASRSERRGVCTVWYSITELTEDRNLLT